MMTFPEFERLARKYRTIPVYERILADLLTPVSAFMRISKASKYAFLLESVEKGTQYSRYSFIGRNPQKIIACSDGKVTITENGTTRDSDEPFLEILRGIRRNYAAPELPGVPRFTGGLVGYLGYETITWVEDIPTHAPDSLNVPNAVFMLFEELLAFDHLKNEALVISNVSVNDTTDLREAYRKARERIDEIGEDLHTDIDYQTPKKSKPNPLYSNMTKKEFETKVLKAKEHIKAGDIFQIVLSQRFHRRTTAEPITIYRALRTINPSPYMFYLKLNDFEVLGASPELLVKVENKQVEIRPIAGTRGRGKDEAEDQSLAEDLLSDEKEKAEHLMLVDLGRNDVGRVSVYGTVEVKEFMIVERYSHVMHIVSDVRGQLREDRDALDALMSGFPAGTLSGAPKIRAMEIIHDLEPTRRNIYSGAVGYMDFTGDLNTCIAIRTLLAKDGTVYFQSGAGIVYDSDPEKEYEETVNKAKAIVSAIDFAENGLVKNKPESGQ